MKSSKKLLALFTALSISTSAFTGLTPLVGAATEDDILWSDTFNNAAVGVFLNGTDSGNLTNNEAIKGLNFVTSSRGGGDRGCYNDADGNYVLGGSYYAVNEKEDATDKYLRLSFPVFGDFLTNGRLAYVDFKEAYTATETTDIVMDFDLKLTNGMTHGAKGANPVLRIGTADTDTKTVSAVEIDKEALNIGDDWVHARIITTATGSKLYINKEEITSAASTATSLAKILLYSADGSSNGSATADLIGGYTPSDGGSYNDVDKPTYTPIADLDNVIIYSEAAGVATGESEAPGAQNQEGGATPKPTATPKVLPAAPAITAPEGVTGLETYTFDDTAAQKWALTTEERNITDIAGLSIHIGSRANGGNVNTYAAVSELQTGKALELQASEFSTAGRAPRVSVDTSKPAADGVSTAMSFNVYLSAAKNHEEDASPRLYLLKDATQAGSDGAGAYRNVAAVITAVEDEVIYRGDNAESDVISAYVTPDEWHTVTFVVTPGDGVNTHRVYIDGSTDAAVKADYVATGENASSMDNLPILTVESSNGDATASFGNVVIDNLLAYQGSVDEPKKLIPTVEAAPTPSPTPIPTPTPEIIANVEMTLDADTNKVTMTSDIDAPAYLIQASYSADGKFTGVKAIKNVSLKGGTAVTATLDSIAGGDKIMLWGNLSSIRPFAEVVIAPEKTPEPTATPTPTPIPTVAPTARPAVDPELIYYSQDYEAEGVTADWTTSVSGRFTPEIKTDGTNTWLGVDMSTRSANACTVTSPSYASYVSGKEEYVLEFDAALGFTNGNQKPSFSVNTSDGYLLQLTTDNCTDWVINGNAEKKLTPATTGNTQGTTSTSTWYHYVLIYKDGDTHLMIRDMDNNIVFGPEIIISGTQTGALTTMSFGSGRYYANIEIDNVVIRGLDEYDQLGERGVELLNDIQWVSQLNTTISQPAEDTPTQKVLQVKANGIYGTDLTNADGVEITWSTRGLGGEDGYITLTKEAGTGAGTEGVSPDGSSTAYFNVRNGVSNWFGDVTVTVKYLDKELSISTPFAVIGAGGSTNIAPMAGYPVSMNDYDDSLIGFVGSSKAIDSQDLVLNGWSMYGSDGTRTFNLSADDDGTKYLRFYRNGSGSGLPVYQLPEQTEQYIVDMTVRFSGDITFGHYFKTPNNSGSDPNWTASYSGGALTVGTQTISGLNSTDWFRVVVSADESANTSWAKVYDKDGTLLGEVNAEPLLSTATNTQKYFCFQGTYPIDLASFKIYKPTAATLVVNAETETIQVPETETPTTVSLSGILKDTDGYIMTGAIDWSLDEEYAGVSITKDGTQGATLSVTNEAGSGDVTVIASVGSVRVEKKLTLSTTGNSVTFTKFGSSLTIPFTGEDSVSQTYAAEARDKNGTAIAGTTVTYSMVDSTGEPVTNLRGVTFNAETGVLTVEPNAAAKVVYIKAVAVVGEETLTARTKVNIHGLSFAFGSDAPADDSYTQVTVADAYTDKLGYGFADISAMSNGTNNVTGTAAYRFKAKVPNGNYVVTVDTTSATMTSEVVEKVSATTGISKSDTQFKVAVCDGVLDLTFLANSTLSSLVITQDAVKSENVKPKLFAIGDSTTNNNASGNISWGNVVNSANVTLPDAIGEFSNNGMAGRDSVNFYNQGRVETVLLNVCPGDYVTVNMGINSKEANEGVSYYTLLDEYYVNGIIQRGGIPVIVTATPLGFSNTQYPYSNGVFTVHRGTGAHNGDLRKIAQKYNLNIIELGYYFDAYFNSLTTDDVTAYNTANGTSFTTVVDLVKSWYGDHNHYKQYLAEKIANYILESVAAIENGSTDFNQANDTHINEQ